ncbi:MAG: YunC family protein [Methanomicrobiales archaeon]|nr:YunC family protein [Methanomicrobiales archaeon]MDI6875141.1 YunC family protein [Methanomicrobiales archaeon]
MCQILVPLKGKSGAGYVIPLGPANLVFVITDAGMVGCGAFDVMALEKFGYPAARVGPATGPAISSIEDLLEGIVRDANPSAERRGIRGGMTGREALDRL